MFGVDEKLTSRVFRLHSHKLHKKRLIEIKAKVSNRINNSVPRTLKYQTLKRTGYISQVKERNNAIVRENQKILVMMEEISAGKRGTSVHQILDSIREIPQPKSLNVSTRKKEAQRIIDDNEALAKRLNDSNQGVSFQKFDEEWLNITKYMTSISKKNIRKLPKLDRDMQSIGSTEINIKKGGTSKSPLSVAHKRNSSMFSPNLTSPLPSKLENFEEKGKNTGKVKGKKTEIEEKKTEIREKKENKVIEEEKAKEIKKVIEDPEEENKDLRENEEKVEEESKEIEGKEEGINEDKVAEDEEKVEIERKNEEKSDEGDIGSNEKEEEKLEEFPKSVEEKSENLENEAKLKSEENQNSEKIEENPEENPEEHKDSDYGDDFEKDPPS